MKWGMYSFFACFSGLRLEEEEDDIVVLAVVWRGGWWVGVVSGRFSWRLKAQEVAARVSVGVLAPRIEWLKVNV